MLPNLILKSRINRQWTESGLDSRSQCLDKDHFNQYPYSVFYNYNSRGFRDSEWPESMEELKNSVWCIGDSFTVGIGSPLEHTWAYAVSQKLNKRIINVSMDGASNNWISRIASNIYKEIKPDYMVVMWSYTHRREREDHLLSDENRRIFSLKTTDSENVENFLNCVERIISNNENCLHLAIPDAWTNDIDITDLTESKKQDWKNIKGSDWPEFPLTVIDYNNLPDFVRNEIVSMGCDETFRLYYNKINLYINVDKKLKDMGIKYYGGRVPRLDIARDGHHFDILTSQWVADTVEKLWADRL
jgi:hypothetical protein